MNQAIATSCTHLALKQRPTNNYHILSDSILGLVPYFPRESINCTRDGYDYVDEM